MHPESEQRAAHLAVSRYGAAAGQVQRLYQQVIEAQNKGRPVDLLTTLVRKKLLTLKQADELRAGLDSTHFDSSPHPRSSAPTVKNGSVTASGQPNGQLNGHDLSRLGDYRILRRLGEGGMGSVYLAFREGDQQHVAVKVLTEQLATSQAAVDRFYREAKSGALLNHPNIVRILGIGKDQATGSHYLVMEYVDGPSALELLGRRGRLSIGDAVHITLDVARALEHAHSRNIIHRDIKPDNILLTRSGLAKLTDLGLAKRTDEASHLTAARQGFGTPYYMPYEQAVNAKYADGRSDIYALGATLYQLVAGEVPFQGSNHLEIVEKKSIGEYPPASSHNPAVPRALDDILDRMLAREPADRFQTASELIVELERSGLCPQLPSFVDADRALQDPVVRERMAAQGQATAQDLQLANRDPRSGVRKANPDIWYLRFRDKTGRLCKAKLTTQQVVSRLREGRFAGAGEMEASHHHSRDFLSLESYEEFAAAAGEAMKSGKMTSSNGETSHLSTFPSDSSIQLATLKLRSISRMWLLASLGTAIAIVAAVLIRVLFWS